MARPSSPLRQRRPRTTALVAAALALSVVSCERSAEKAGDRPAGVTCKDAAECAGGYCVAGVAGDQPACTRTCATGDDCPDGWSCSAVTDRGVLVCQRGGSTPFGM